MFIKLGIKWWVYATALALITMAGSANAFTACDSGDAKGTWRLFMSGADATGAPFSTACVLVTDGKGNFPSVSGSQCTEKQGATIAKSVVAGGFKVKRNCRFSVNMTFEADASVCSLVGAYERGLKTSGGGVTECTNGRIGGFNLYRAR